MIAADSPRSHYATYACAVVSVTLALVARLLLTPVVGDQFPFTLFYIGIAITAWFGGLRPALAAAVLGGLLADFFLLDPKHSLHFMAVDDVVGIAMYAATSLGIAILAGSMHAARHKAETASEVSRQQRMELDKANEHLEARVLERTQELTRANARMLQSRDQLQTSESRFRSYVESAPIGILVADAQRRLIEGNRAAAKLFRYRSGELESLTVADIHAPENHSTVEQAFRSLEETGYSDGIFRLVRRDGTTFWASLRATALPGGDTMAFIRDISEEKRIEEALRTSETRLRLLVEGVSDHAIFMLDAEGRILTWTKGAEQIYGYRESDLVGRYYSLLFPPQSIASGKPEQELAEAKQGGKCEIEGWRIRENGKQFWVAGTVAAVHDDEGRVIGFAKVTRDITAKRRNDELLHSVLDHTLDGIITINDRGVISTINQAGENIFGYRAVELVGENVRCLMPDPDRSRHDTYIANYVRTGEAKIIGIGREVRGQRKDGTTFPMDLAITEFNLDDQRYFVGIVRDISEQKRLEAQLFQSQKMEAFGQLAGGVAHDFNNLLTLINGYSQILQRMVPAADGKQKMLGQIFRAGQRAASLTQQLLAFSRQQVLEPKVLDINAIVLDTEVMLRRLIGEDIELATVLYPHLSAVRADPGQIEQVIMNLAVNARDAMPLGGKLTIETSETEIGAPAPGQPATAEPGRYVTISMSDTGTGMPPEVRSRVFEPFFTTKGVGKGTGLGLAVAHGIVKQSGGTIDVYSEPGVGSTFKVRLPALRNGTASATEPGTAHSTTGTETILLVEDDENVREFVAVALESFGYSVLTASDGKAAVLLYAKRKAAIDLVVTDVVMPEMSGRVLAETLQATDPGLKVLFLSGYTDDAVVRHGILQANVSFLQKPFTPDALARKVREVIDQA